MKKKTKKKNLTMTEMGGHVMDLHFDGKCEKLNIGLGTIKEFDEMPCIIFEDWTGDENAKTKRFFVMHIKAALELKSIIDSLVFDYLWDKTEDNES